jgi:hypothetical protein
MTVLRATAAVQLTFLCACSSQAPQATHIAASNSVHAGEYAVLMAACNDCHTPGWPQSGGKIPESKWLTGNSVGFRGPWGVAYPVNVRLFAASISRQAWIALFEAAPSVPIMPFENYGHGRIAASDLGAIYDFIISLGKAGEPAPNDLAPGKVPTTLYINFVPESATPRH